MLLARAAIGTHAWDEAWTSVRGLGTETIVDEVLTDGGLATTRLISHIDELTPREREVAQLAARGLSNRAIGQTVVIAEKTAANHLQNALDKLDVHSRSELAARPLELGLLP